MIRLLAVLLLAGSPAVAPAQVAEPHGYRLGEYRGPVPATLQGATVIDPDEARALWEDGGASFIDVLPQAPKPAGLPEGTIWRDKPRDTIPGALWLPNVGYGAISEGTAEYFRRGLEKGTDDDASLPVVIFCLDECWMSWNAARRAVEWGYTDVHWFPEGTDGWAFEGFPLERVKPLEPQPHAGG